MSKDLLVHADTSTRGAAAIGSRTRSFETMMLARGRSFVLNPHGFVASLLDGIGIALHG